MKLTLAQTVKLLLDRRNEVASKSDDDVVFKDGSRLLFVGNDIDYRRESGFKTTIISNNVTLKTMITFSVGKTVYCEYAENDSKVVLFINGSLIRIVSQTRNDGAYPEDNYHTIPPIINLERLADGEEF